MNDEGVSGSHAVGIEGGLAALEDQLDLPLEAVEGINDGRGNLQVCEIPVVVVFRPVQKPSTRQLRDCPSSSFFTMRTSMGSWCFLGVGFSSSRFRDAGRTVRKAPQQWAGRSRF